jgi:hypothetical protein
MVLKVLRKENRQIFVTGGSAARVTNVGEQ